MTGEDPVRRGFVASFNRPDGNITGVTILSGELAAKRFELLRELVPHAKTIATLINSDFGPSGRFQADVEEAARALGLSMQQMLASNEREIDDAFNTLAQARIDALLVGPSPFLDSRRHQLVTLAARIRIPAGYETRGHRAGRRSNKLWTQRCRWLSSSRHLRRKNSPGHQAGRPACRTADQIRAGRQFENCKNPWPYRAR